MCCNINYENVVGDGAGIMIISKMEDFAVSSGCVIRAIHAPTVIIMGEKLCKEGGVVLLGMRYVRMDQIVATYQYSQVVKSLVLWWVASLYWLWLRLEFGATRKEKMGIVKLAQTLLMEE